MRNKPTAVAAMLIASAVFLCAAEDAPSWVREAAAATLPAYPAKVNSVVLFTEEKTIVDDSGRFLTTTRSAAKVLTKQGTNIQFFDQYDTDGGKVREFRAWLIPPSGKVKKYGKDEILDVACAENDIYNQCRRRVVSSRGDGEPGAIFAYESVIEHRSFGNQLEFFFQHGMPVRLARFAVTIPAGWELKAIPFQGAPPEPAVSGNTHTWQMENLPHRELEPNAPSYLSIAPWIAINLLPPGGRQRAVLTWQEASQLISELQNGQYELDAAMTAKAQALIAEAHTELEKIQAIGRFVQQVHYVSIQTNVSKGGGYRPHAAAQVFQKLYGDCKDKANLMRAMLRAAGLTAYPVAIYSGDRTHVSDRWPSLGAFNHAITAIAVSAETKAPAVAEHPKLGRLLFFDPTDPYVPVGLLPDHEQGSLALVGGGENGGLMQVPAAAPEPDWQVREVEARLNADGGIDGSFVETSRLGALSGARSQVRGLSKTDYTKSIERWIGRSIAGAKATAIETTDKEDSMTLKASFSAARFAQVPQPSLMIVRATPLEEEIGPRLTEKSRQYPVVVDADGFRESVRILLPPGVKVDELPGALSLRSPFGEFDAKWEAPPGAVVFTRRVAIKAQTVPPEKYQELKKFLDLVQGASRTPVVLIK
ncbi:MAG: DUF3857 domain-containing protein [Bryobacteraceae bacterium]